MSRKLGSPPRPKGRPSLLKLSNVQPPPPEFFSLSFVQNLADKYKVEGHRRIKELHRALEGWARIYHAHRLGYDERLGPGEMRSELLELSKAIKNLHTKLEGLGPETADRFWSPENLIDSFSFRTPDGRSPFGHIVYRVPLADGGTAVWWINKEHHFESLKIMQNYCGDALARLPAGSKGRRESQARRIWVINVIRYWTEVLGRPFSAKAHKGQPATNGAAFCIDAFKLVDPSVSTASLLTAMRNARKARRMPSVARNTRK